MTYILLDPMKYYAFNYHYLFGHYAIGSVIIFFVPKIVCYLQYAMSK